MTDPHQSWTEQSETQQITTAGARHAAPVLRAEADPAPVLDPTGEPVVIAQAVTVILGALVTLGWVAIPSTVIDTVGTVLSLAISVVATVMARARVTPLQGGIMATIERYVAELVSAELAKYKMQ